MITELIHSFKNVEKIKNSEIVLSVQLGLNGFSFSILDKPGQQILLCETYAFKPVTAWKEVAIALKKEVSKHLEDQQAFELVSVAFFEKNTQMIPSALFDQEKMEDYYKLAFSSDLITNSRMRNYEVDVFGCQVVCPFADDLPSELEKAFAMKTVLVENATAVLLRKLGRLKQKDLKSFLILRSGIMELAVVASEQLQFYNVFSYKDKKDILFYLAQLLKTLNVSQSALEVGVLGVEKNQQEIVRFLSDYFPMTNELALPVHSAVEDGVLPYYLLNLNL